jgi:hypothetical protein
MVHHLLILYFFFVWFVEWNSLMHRFIPHANNETSMRKEVISLNLRNELMMRHLI